MKKIFTLKALGTPSFELTSTLTFNILSDSKETKTISIPPYLYYALKAKTLANLNIMDEQQANNQDINKAVVKRIHLISNQTFQKLVYEKINIKCHVSTVIQGRILNYILNEPIDSGIHYNNKKATSINATRSKKNITIPDYLLTKLSILLGGEKSARLLIHSTSFNIMTTLKEQGYIDSSGNISKLVSKTSWSRKVHNSLFEQLIKMSTLNNLNGKYCIFDVKLCRNEKYETKK